MAPQTASPLFAFLIAICFSTTSQAASEKPAPAAAPTTSPSSDGAPIVGPAGQMVIVARAVHETAATKLPVSIRLCNTVATPDKPTMSVSWGKKADAAVAVPAGKCLEVDQPTRVSFETKGRATAVSKGFYQTFASGTFQTEPQIVDPPAAVPVSVTGAPQTATCLQRNYPGSPQISTDIWGACAAKGLTGRKNYRVCFDEKAYSRQAGALPYNVAYIPMVFDEKLLTATPSSPDGFGKPDTYNLIAPGGCRDLYGVDKATFLVFRNGWNHETLESIAYTVQELP